MQPRGRFALALAAALAVAAVGPPVAPAGPRAAPAGPPAATPPCFGAASRDPDHPCANPRLRFSVTPLPADAQIEPSAACTLVAITPPPSRVCAFGVPKAQAAATVALVGDSHAPAWRGAVDVLVRAQRWRGLTVRRSSCPFTFARHYGGRATGDACLRWIHDSIRFLGRHPEIHTVFVIASSAYAYVPAGGQDPHATAVAGFRAAFDALPPSVQHVVVIRDNPQATAATLPCVDRARLHRERADIHCALPRATALLPDAPADAAAQMAAGRVRSIDLSPFFCDERLCYPVVGGALVYKDSSHITTTFGTTLGPYLVGAYRALGLPPA